MKPAAIYETHISTAGPYWNEFHTRAGCAAFLRAKYRAGLAWRCKPGVYGLGGMGCLAFVLTKPGARSTAVIQPCSANNFTVNPPRLVRQEAQP